jgi:hypothetical protein
MANSKLDCPSSSAEGNTKILGIKLHGKVSLLPQPIPVSKEFLLKANEDNNIHADFRFTGKCIEKSCKQWAGNKCGLLNNLLHTMEKNATAIPDCPIRNTCRWHQQEGFAACKICTLVTYIM